MSERTNADVVKWVTLNVLPFEADLRRTLRRLCNGQAEVDDVVQETYCKLLTLDSVEHIREPKAFLLRTAKNLVMDRMRRDAVVSIEATDDLEELVTEDTAPSAERVATARAELRWVAGLIGRLPERCKAVFTARRIEGMSQNEAAVSLGISVGIVEQETMKGMELISDMIANVGVEGLPKPVRTRKHLAVVKRTDVSHR